MRSYHKLRIAICCLISTTGCVEEELPVVEIAEPVKKQVVKKPVFHPDIPKRCQKVVPYLKGFVNPSWSAAQLDQESNCNYYAVSHVGAQGVAQIMPQNLGWLGSKICAGLGEPNPYNPAWAIPCFEKFMQWHSIDLFDNYCDNLYVDSQRYNGGYYVILEVRASKEKTLAGGHKICGTRLPNGRKRSKASCKENYEYPVKISERQKNFMSLGGKKC